MAMKMPHPMSTLRTWFSEEPTPRRMAVVFGTLFGLSLACAWGLMAFARAVS